MADPHMPFAVINRTVNPFVRALLASPAHRLASRNLMLLTVTGRRSGRAFTIPVGYHQDGDRLRVNLEWPERKRWWRNVHAGGVPVSVVLRGVTRPGIARLTRDENGAPGVTIELS